MPDHDALAGHTLDPGQLDVILCGLIHHVPPGPQRVVGDGREGETGDGQDTGGPGVAVGVEAGQSIIFLSTR